MKTCPGLEELAAESKQLERHLDKVKKKGFTKRRDATSNLGRWEVEGPPRMMKTMWRALQVCIEDLQIGLVPRYLNPQYSLDRDRAERDKRNELEQVPKMETLREKIRKQLAYHTRRVQ